MLSRPASAAARIVAALDTPDLARAEALAAALAPPRCGVLNRRRPCHSVCDTSRSESIGSLTRSETPNETSPSTERFGRM